MSELSPREEKVLGKMKLVDQEDEKVLEIYSWNSE